MEKRDQDRFLPSSTGTASIVERQATRQNTVRKKEKGKEAEEEKEKESTRFPIGAERLKDQLVGKRRKTPKEATTRLTLEGTLEQ